MPGSYHDARELSFQKIKAKAHKWVIHGIPSSKGRSELPTDFLRQSADRTDPLSEVVASPQPFV